jgi:hypothetical protein
VTFPLDRVTLDHPRRVNRADKRNQPIIFAKGRRAFTGDRLWQAFAAARDAEMKAKKVAEPFAA